MVPASGHGVPVECGQLKRLRSPGRYSLLKWCVIPDWTNSIRRFARSSAACCSAAVTMVASGPGYTVATWSLSSQRTMYGGEPSAECTSVISPRCSGWSMVKPSSPANRRPWPSSQTLLPSTQPLWPHMAVSAEGLQYPASMAESPTRASSPRQKCRDQRLPTTVKGMVITLRRGVLSRLPRRVFAPVTRSRARSRTRSTSWRAIPCRSGGMAAADRRDADRRGFSGIPAPRSALGPQSDDWLSATSRACSIRRASSSTSGVAS